MTLISCVVVWLCTFLACIYPILFKCGVLHRLFDSRFCQNLFVDNRNQLHTFFLLLHYAIEELYGFELQHIINSNYIVMQTKTVVGYLAPEIEVNFVVVEQGIAASNMEQIGIIYDEQEW